MNVALYAPHGNRWAMTERGRRALRRGPRSVRIGESAMEWSGDGLAIDIDEMAVPRPPAEWLPQRLCGTVRLVPDVITNAVTAIGVGDRHIWYPIAPLSRIEASFTEPYGFQWSGHGYFDSNWGTEPLEAGFVHWDWARTRLTDGSAAIVYDSQRRDGSRQRLGLRFGADGSDDRFEPPESIDMKPGFWGVARGVPCAAGHKPVLVRTLEDSPFYNRSIIETHILGETARFMHESFSGRRFASPIVKMMLPFRMPRWTGR